MKLSLASRTSFPDTHNTYHLLRRTQETLAVIIIFCVWGAVLSPGRGQDLTPWSHLCYWILHIVTICMCACPPLSLAFHPQDLTQSHCLIRMVDWLNSCLVAAVFSTTPLFPPRAILCESHEIIEIIRQSIFSAQIYIQPFLLLSGNFILLMVLNKQMEDNEAKSKLKLIRGLM